MKADQVQTRPRHQRGQTLHELHRCHHVVAGAIAPRRLELQHDLPGAVHTEPLIGNRRAGDIAAQLLQPTPVIGRATHAGVQAETVGVGAKCRGFITSCRTAGKVWRWRGFRGICWLRGAWNGGLRNSIRPWPLWFLLWFP